MDDIWIPLGENMLIETFKPIWNWAIDGFGNNAPGKGRVNQSRSLWDVLHPGRRFARQLPLGPISEEFILQRIEDFFAERELAKLPKPIADQQAEAESDAEEAADEA